jgi:hypothetical protein
MFRLEPFRTKTEAIQKISASVGAVKRLRRFADQHAHAIDAVHVDAAGFLRGENHGERQQVPGDAERDHARRRTAAEADEPDRKHRHRPAGDQVCAGIGKHRAGIAHVGRERLGKDVGLNAALDA